MGRTFRSESGEAFRFTAEVLEETSPGSVHTGDWTVYEAQFEVEGWLESEGTLGYCNEGPCKWNPWGIPSDGGRGSFQEGAVAIKSWEPSLLDNCLSEFAQFSMLADGEFTSTDTPVVEGDLRMESGLCGQNHAVGTFRLEAPGR